MMKQYFARLKSSTLIISRMMIRFRIWRHIQYRFANITPQNVRNILANCQKHLSISFFAVMFAGGSFITAGRETNVSLASVFPAAPDEIAIIVDDVKQYTPTIDENSHDVVLSLSERNDSYFQQLSILSLGTDTGSNQFSEIGEVYVVQDGDSYAKIAANAGLRTGSLLVANNIDAKKIKSDPSALTLKKEQKIIIPYENLEDNDNLFQAAVDAASSRKDAITQIANNKKGSKSLATNNKGKTLSFSSTGKRDYTSYLGFTGGWCTAYVAKTNPRVASAVRSVGGGNASAWPSQARAAGLKVDKAIVVGAVAYTNESRYGHISIIEEDLGNTVKISEMNGPAGRGVIGIRIISKSLISAVIR